MSDVAIITDSIACLTSELIEQHRIKIVPINIHFRGKEYRDWLDISPSEAYQLFLQDPDSFSTSPASPWHFLEAYREASKWARNVLCITISSKLSTCFNSARIAMEQAKDEIRDTAVEVVDSQNVTAAQGFVVLAAARAADEGKPFPEVKKAAEDMRNRVTFYFVLDTIRHVYRTGRIPKIASQAASLLNVKPILSSRNGLVTFAGAVRNKEKGIKRTLNLMSDKVGKEPVHVAVMHAYTPEEAEDMKERIASQFNCAELWIAEFSPVMGYACGTGTVGFAFYK